MITSFLSNSQYRRAEPSKPSTSYTVKRDTINAQRTTRTGTNNRVRNTRCTFFMIPFCPAIQYMLPSGLWCMLRGEPGKSVSSSRSGNTFVNPGSKISADQGTHDRNHPSQAKKEPRGVASDGALFWAFTGIITFWLIWFSSRMWSFRETAVLTRGTARQHPCADCRHAKEWATSTASSDPSSRRHLPAMHTVQ